MRLAIEPSGGRRTRIWSSVASAGLGTGLLLVLALPSVARINGTEPPSDHVEQGESTSFVVALGGAGVTCVLATPHELSITVTVDVVSACGNANRTVEIRVATSALTPTGEHAITIREVDALGGAVDQRVWSLTVVAKAVTSSSTTTPVASTSPTTSTSSTTAPPTTTTTASQSAATSTTNPPGGSGPAAPTTTDRSVPLPASTTTPTTTQPTTTTSSTPAAGLETAEGGPGGPSSPGPAEASVIPTLTRTLRDALGSLLPASVADIVVSPLLILDVVARAVLTSGWTLIPTALAGVWAGWAIWKLAPDARAANDPAPGRQFLSTGDPS